MKWCIKCQKNYLEINKKWERQWKRNCQIKFLNKYIKPHLKLLNFLSSFADFACSSKKRFANSSLQIQTLSMLRCKLSQFQRISALPKTKTAPPHSIVSTAKWYHDRCHICKSHEELQIKLIFVLFLTVDKELTEDKTLKEKEKSDSTTKD